MSPMQFNDIIRGTSDDPFAQLGPRSDGEQRQIVAFAPEAERLFALVGDASYPLNPLDGAPGIYTGTLPAEGSYELQKHTGKGDSVTYKDPYSFGPVIGEMDEYLLGEGTHEKLWQVLGAHVIEHEGVQGTHFAVWAPNAKRVSVVGDFNDWDGRRTVMRRRGASGVWEIFLPDVGDGSVYKYEILDRNGNLLPLKADPVGFGAQHPPETASVVRDISGYGWDDAAWMKSRKSRNTATAPISIYEVHLGSWRKDPSQNGRPISYKEAAEELVSYVSDMGFTHIELLPISEYPFDGSWGYQPVGLYAPTVRHGPPHEFRDLVDAAHQKGLGVILDWVPAHFPSDAHGLGNFDGTALYEHADPKEGFHKDWNTLIYNFGRTEVANFLISNARYWISEYHVDGLRVDAVASMLYRDYSRDEGEWVPNKDGGRENYEAIDLLKRMNSAAYGVDDSIMTIAEESTAFPGVSKPTDAGGLGFGFKWNMGWMNDTLSYMTEDPVHRKYHHHKMTFGLVYAFSENFVLPISHDEVVHGKGSMLDKMPGDRWQKFANLRAFYGFMWGHPGKKLLFMGQEFGQAGEWNHNEMLPWHCLEDNSHRGMQSFVRDLNFTYRDTPALYKKDTDPDGFEWILTDEAETSVYAWVRHGDGDDAPIVVICNFTPVVRQDFTIGLPSAGVWREVLNSDDQKYGGSGVLNGTEINASEAGAHGKPASAQVTIPPLATIMLQRMT